MPDAMIDLMASLTEIMKEETNLLKGRERAPGLAELAAAKARLVGQLEETLARRNRLEAGWIETIEPEARERLDACLSELRAASTENADILERQIELSTDMLSAIASEARRLAGNRSYTYGASGGLARADQPTPISFNTEY